MATVHTHDLNTSVAMELIFRRLPAVTDGQLAEILHVLCGPLHYFDVSREHPSLPADEMTRVQHAVDHGSGLGPAPSVSEGGAM